MPRRSIKIRGKVHRWVERLQLIGEESDEERLGQVCGQFSVLAPAPEPTEHFCSIAMDEKYLKGTSAMDTTADQQRQGLVRVEMFKNFKDLLRSQRRRGIRT